MSSQDVVDRLCELLGDFKKSVKTDLRMINKRVDKLEKSLTPSRSTAGQRVADVFELLEPILRQLDMRTLLLAQRVSRRFKVVINSSDKLQEALFFKPAAKLPQPNPNAFEINPLLTDYNFYRRIPLQLRYDVPVFAAYPWETGTMPLAPLATARVAAHPSLPKTDLYVHSQKFPSEFRDPIVTTSPRPHLVGSWRKMYFTQPPVHIQTNVGQSGNHSSLYTIRYNQCVFGDLFKWESKEMQFVWDYNHPLGGAPKMRVHELVLAKNQKSVSGC